MCVCVCVFCLSVYYLHEADDAARKIRPAGLAFFNSGSFKFAIHSTTKGFNVFSIVSPLSPARPALNVATTLPIPTRAASSKA